MSRELRPMSFRDLKSSDSFNGSNEWGSSAQGQQPPRNSSRGGGTEVEYLSAHRRLTDAVRGFQRLTDSIASASKYLGTRTDTRLHRENLHNTIDRATEAARSIKIQLAELPSKASGTESAATRRQRAVQLKKIAKDFEALLQRHQRVVETTLSKEQESAAVVRRSFDEQKGGAKTALDEEQSAGLLDHQLLDGQIQFNEYAVQEREEEISHLQKSMVEVQEVFQDLAVIVQDQGEQIDMIESNVADARDKTESGVNNLKKATVFQQAVNNKLFWIFICLLFFVVIGLVIALKPWSK